MNDCRAYHHGTIANISVWKLSFSLTLLPASVKFSEKKLTQNKQTNPSSVTVVLLWLDSRP